MKIYFQFLVTFIFFVAVSASHATEAGSEVDNGSGSVDHGGGGGVSSGGGRVGDAGETGESSGTGDGSGNRDDRPHRNPRATNSPASSASGITIACLADDGRIVGGNSETTCAAILPKCADLKKEFEANIRNTLSMKIWGYYNGKDIELDKSTVDHLTGLDLNVSLCSVVGHTVQVREKGAAVGDLEDTRQSIAKRLYCGKRPSGKGDHQGGFLGLFTKDELVLRFNTDQDGQWGSLWASYMMGTYPWLIRKHAAAVLNAIKPDLSNLNQIIRSNPAVKQDLAKIFTQMNTYYKDLGNASKSACADGISDLFNKCKSGSLSLLDPSNRLCTIVKAQVAINGAALPNILIQEIMSRVQVEYDSYFSGMLAHHSPAVLGIFNGLFDSPMTSSSPFDTFFNACQRSADGSGFLGSTPRKKYSCVASCLFDGEDFYTGPNYTVTESKGDGRSSRRCTNPVKISIEDGSVKFGTSGFTSSVNGGEFHTKTSMENTGENSIHKGFAGFIEYIIRNKICGQKKNTDRTVCDQINIPDKPEGAR